MGEAAVLHAMVTQIHRLNRANETSKNPKLQALKDLCGKSHKLQRKAKLRRVEGPPDESQRPDPDESQRDELEIMADPEMMEGLIPDLRNSYPDADESSLRKLATFISKGEPLPDTLMNQFNINKSLTGNTVDVDSDSDSAATLRVGEPQAKPLQDDTH